MESSLINRAASIAAGLLLVLPVAAFGQSELARPTTVEIVLSNFAFTPSALSLHAGQSYRLHVVNHGSGGHNFAAKEFFAAARIAPEDAQLVRGGVIELGKGETRDIRLVPARGTYKVKCTHFLHSSFGMKGEITVT